MKINSVYEHFTSKEIKPTGWLKRQLEIQAEGLSGNLDKIWPDIRDSAWIGGTCEGWERVPYWLDGFIPLAFLLDNADLKSRAKKYIDAIIDRQDEDGWICPCSKEARATYDTWATILISKVLIVYFECSGDERAFDAAEKALKQFKEHIRWNTLFNWGQSRWFEALIPIFAIYKRKPQRWLEQLAVTLGTQGLDYKRLFACWQDQLGRKEWSYQTHIVNLMMALKSEALFSTFSDDNPGCFAHKMFDTLLKYHGSPLGFINGDECLPGNEAIHGAELCSIAEAMYSFEILFEITGDTEWIKKLEEFAFNMLPATISDDMWTHQYLQTVNQIACTKQNEPPIFYTNNIDAHCFGLEPHFGCCTANFNQAWPKFVLSAFMKSELGLVITSPVPAEVTFNHNGADITVSTNSNYPFGDSAVYKISASVPTELTVDIRIPNCKCAVLDGKAVEPNSIVSLNRVWDNAEITLSLEYEMEFNRCAGELYTLKRGPIYFAAPLSDKKTVVEYTANGVERKFPYCDYDIVPTEEWGFGFTEAQLNFQENGIKDYPFSRENPPMEIDTELSLIDWGTAENQPNVCAALPKSLKEIKRINKRLVPYGCTTLRMAAMPKTDK